VGQGNHDLVSCRSDYSYADRPTSFVWNGERYDIGSIEREWLEPGTKHFIVKAAKAGIPAVVLVQLKDREPVRWKNLSDVWQLVMEKDKTPFTEYVQNEVCAFLKEEETESKKAESKENTSSQPTAGDVPPGESLPIP